MRMPLKNAKGSHMKEQMRCQKLSLTERLETKASRRSYQFFGADGRGRARTMGWATSPRVSKLLTCMVLISVALMRGVNRAIAATSMSDWSSCHLEYHLGRREANSK